MERDDAFRLLFKSGVVIYAGTIFELGASFIAKVLIAQYLGRFDYGTVNVGLTFLTFSAGLLIFGLNSGVSRFVPRYDDEQRQWITIFLGYCLGLPLPLLVAGFTVLNAEWLATTVFRAPNAGPVLRVFALGLPFAVFVDLSKGGIRGFQRSTPRVVIDNFAMPFSRLLLVGVFLAIGASALEMAIAYVVPWIVGGVLAVVFLRQGFRKLRTIIAGIEGEWFVSMSKDLVVFSAPLVLTAITSQVLNDLDVLLLSYFKSTGDVGIYTVVYPLAKLISVPLTAFGYIILPILSEQHSDGQEDDMRTVYQMGTKWTVFAAIPVVSAFVLYPTRAISLTFGGEYAGGALALVVLSVGFLFVSLAGFNSSTLTSIGATRFIAIANFVGAAVNVGLNVYLIPQYSFVGAAVATSIAVFIINVAMSWKLYRETGIQPLTWRLVRPLAIAMPLIGGVHYFAKTQTSATPLVLVGAIALSGVLYVGAILLLGGFGEEELVIVESVEERFEVDLGFVKRFLT